MKELEQWLKAFGEFEEKHQIAVNDIPSIDLYIDQVTTFIDDNLHFFKRDEEDKILTKTMINNYTKQQVLPPPHNKKYSRAHMVLLILVYQLKQVMSIHDIQSLLMSTHPGEPPNEEEKNSLTGLYEHFLTLQREQYQKIPEDTAALAEGIKKQVADMDTSDPDRTAYLLLVLCLISQASAQKLLAERIIDTIFAPPEKDEKQKPEKDKDKKEKQKNDRKRPS
jgi:DNA-binding transcriptional MerR regulator